MKLTNKHNLPIEFCNAVRRSEQQRDYVSPSMLTKGIRQIILERRHFDEIEYDAMDSLWALFGTAVHKVIDINNPLSDTERTLKGDFGGREMWGTADLFDEKQVINDWKVTSAWSIVYGSKLHDWTVQLNAYKRLFEKNDYVVRGMVINAILRDWSKNKAKASADYPQTPVVQVKIDPMPNIDDYIIDRIDAIQDASQLDDDDLPICTMKERWQDPTKYAVMVNGKKRSLKNHDTLNAAEKHAADIGGYVEERPSEPRNCLDYCPVSKWCNKFQNWKKNNELQV